MKFGSKDVNAPAICVWILFILVVLGIASNQFKSNQFQSISKNDANLGKLPSIQGFDVLSGTKQYSKKRKPRIIFFAGLPYSNQDMINNVLQTLCDKRCISFLDLAPFEEQFFFPRLVKDLIEAKEKESLILNTMLKKLSDESIYFVNVYNHKSSTDIEVNLTYPDISTKQIKDKSLRHPNVLFLEEFFVNHGFDPLFVCLFNNLDSISSKSLNLLQKEEKQFKKTHTIAALRMLDMNLRNLVAQFSLLHPSRRITLDFSLFRDFEQFDDFLTQSKRFEDITGLLGFTELLKENLEFIEADEVHLDKGSTTYLKKMSRVQSFYSQKFHGRALEQKKVINSDTNRPRFVFFAGLEGTGHHLWRDITKEIHLDSNELAKPVGNCQVSHLFFTSKLSCFQAFADRKGVFCSSGSENYQSSYDKAVMTLNTLDETFQEEEVVLLNLAHFNYFKSSDDKDICAAIASYPAFSGRDKNLNKVDLLEFAEIFDTLPNLEFKPIVLLRKTGDFVYSDVWRRKFHRSKPLVYEEKVLENNAASLLVELEVLGNHDLACLDFNSLVTNENETDKAADTLRISRKSLKDIVARIYTKNATQPEQELPEKHEQFLTTLRRYNTELYKLCSKPLI